VRNRRHGDVMKFNKAILLTLILFSSLFFVASAHADLSANSFLDFWGMNNVTGTATNRTSVNGTLLTEGGSAATLTAGKIQNGTRMSANQAWASSGTGRYSININSSKTVSVWIKPNATYTATGCEIGNSGGIVHIGNSSNTATGGGWYLCQVPAGYQLTREVPGGGGGYFRVNASVGINSTAYNHLAYTWNTTTRNISMYYNGVLVNSSIAPYWVAGGAGVSDGFRIGSAAAGVQWNGTIDSVLVDNTSAYGTTDIEQLYCLGAGNEYPFTACGAAAATNFSITAKDFYTGTSLTNLSVSINGTTYNTINGTLNTPYLTNWTALLNFTVNSSDNGGYRNQSYLNVNISSGTWIANLSQSAITFYAVEKVSGANVSGANFTTSALTNVTHYMNAGQAYSVLAIRANYFNLTVACAITPFCTASALTTVDANISGMYSTQFNVSLVNNLTGASISNFSYTIVSLNYSWNETGNANGTTANINLINGSYNITFNISGFVTTMFNVTISQGGIVNQTFRIYAENSIYFYFFNASSLLPITSGQNITIALSQGTTIISNVTNASSFFMSGIPPGLYALTISTTGFTNYNAFVTVGNNSFQTFNVYLNTLTSNNAIFTVVDINTAAPIQGAIASIETQPFINQSYVFIGAVATDVTGQFLLNYIQFQNYRISISATGYITKTFNLTPVISSTYQVQLTPTTIVNVSDNYQDVQVQVDPWVAYAGTPFNFTYLIAAPSGNLQQFNYTITNNYNTSFSLSGSSNNAFGGILNDSFIVQNTTLANLSIIVQYKYILSSGLAFTFMRIIPIQPAPGASTSAGVGGAGLSLWDRILISVLVVVMFAGIITWFSNEVFGGVLAICIFGYFILTGFLPLWAGAISITVLFVFVAGASAR